MLANVVLSHRYFALVVLAILEGPFVAVACGIGSALRVLNPFIAYGILIGGDLLPDLMYYGIGRIGVQMTFVHRVATHTRLIRENFPPIEHLWRDRPLVTLMAAKLAYGMAPPFIVSAGLSGLPVRRFLRYSLIVSVPYLGVLFGLGFGLTRMYGTLPVSRFTPYLITAIGVCCAAALIFVVRHARRILHAGKPSLEESSLIDGAVPRRSKAQRHRDDL